MRNMFYGLLLACTTANAQPATTLAFLRDSLVLPVVRRELPLYMKALGTPGQALPDRAMGVAIGGDFTRPSLAETFASFDRLNPTSPLPNTVSYIKPWLLAEAPQAHTFSQLFSVRTLVNYQPVGTWKLQDNPIWQAMTTAEREVMRAGLDFRRSYDVATGAPVNGRPLNYLAVGLLIGAHAQRLGLDPDPAHLNLLAEKCALLVEKGGGFLDDDKAGRGRYDRYGREFNQFCWEAFELMHRADLQQRIRPAVLKMNQVWLDMVSPTTGFAFPYGRSLQNSWEDSWEQCAFMANNPSVNPTTLPVLAGIYTLAFRHYIQHQFNPETHLSRMAEPGRGTYSYVTPNRVFTYSVHSFGKLMMSFMALTAALEKAQVTTWPATPALPNVSRWLPIAHPGRTMGWWLVRNPGNYWVLPVVGSFKGAGTSDYAPVPFGFEGIEQPVQQQGPLGVPQWTLANGDVVSTNEGADSASLSADGTTLTLVWLRLNNQAGILVDAGMTVTSTWRWEDKELSHQLSYVPTKDQVFKKFEFWLPTTYANANLATGTVFADDGRIMRVNCNTEWETQMVVHGTRDTPLGKGPFHPIPLILKWVGGDIPAVKNRRYVMDCKLQHIGN